MSRKKKKRILPRSGNALVDWHLRKLVYFLENKVDKIFITRGPLRSPDERRVYLSGYIYFFDAHHGGIDRSIIFISGARNKHPNKDVAGMTLAHELLHALLSVWERDVVSLEKILWESFTEEQKNFIKSYLPKHKVNKQPHNVVLEDE